MNMHGVMIPVDTGERTTRGWIEHLRAWVMRHYMLFLLVVIPTTLVAGYLYLVASDQYESEAHFLVRSQNTTETIPGTGISQALSMVTGASAAQNEAMSVADYLTSHDVVTTLRREDNLVARFRRNGIDFLSKLRKANPTPELLLKYYNKQVKVKYNTETGITTLTVHAFTPQDSRDIAGKLLYLGEKRVNELNKRSYHDSVAVARRQLDEAEQQLEAVQGQITRFRQSHRDIDPEATGKAHIGLVTDLTQELASVQAQLSQMHGSISPSSPQYRAVAARARALAAQVAAQSSRLAGGNNAIAKNISGYEDMQVRLKFLSTRYEAAAASLDRAREQALRQQLYIVRVVQPNMPVKSLYPERARIVFTVLIALLLTYSIGWLIAAGVREHAA